MISRSRRSRTVPTSSRSDPCRRTARRRPPGPLPSTVRRSSRRSTSNHRRPRRSWVSPRRRGTESSVPWSWRSPWSYWPWSGGPVRMGVAGLPRGPRRLPRPVGPLLRPRHPSPRGPTWTNCLAGPAPRRLRRHAGSRDPGPQSSDARLASGRSTRTSSLHGSKASEPRSIRYRTGCPTESTTSWSASIPWAPSRGWDR